MARNQKHAVAADCSAPGCCARGKKGELACMNIMANAPHPSKRKAPRPSAKASSLVLAEELVAMESVGEAVGLDVMIGVAVGTGIGTAVGTGVGENEIVGNAVGAGVGACDGAGVGAAEGANVDAVTESTLALAMAAVSRR